MTKKKKLIEVTLPLETISAACRRDKDRKRGTIKNVHKWFAPMPAPAWRALLAAALLDDPGDIDERRTLLDLLRRLIPDDGAAPSKSVLEDVARRVNLAGLDVTVLDPFCGGGSTLVEAQRLGLHAAGSDLNPVAVLISKAIAELVPAAAGQGPYAAKSDQFNWAIRGNLSGFVGDLKHYAHAVRDYAWKQVGHLYPQTQDGQLVTAWLWARNVTCPNPSCRSVMPLYTSGWLRKKKGDERWLRPVLVDGHVRFEVSTGPPSRTDGSKLGRGARFRCVVCQQIADEPYVKAEAVDGQMGVQLMAIVANDARGRRTFLDAAALHESVAVVEPPDGSPSIELPSYTRWFSSPSFGMTTQADLYTPRQLHAMAAFADGVDFAYDQASASGAPPSYVDALMAVLGLCIGKLAQSNSTQVRWFVHESGQNKPVQAFGRQALPMIWDFAEVNPFGGSVGDWLGQLDSVLEGLSSLPPGVTPASVYQCDARSASGLVKDGSALVATDPPYFGQIGYADLSDYFYVWQRRALLRTFPDLFSTLSAPKAQELVAVPYRHGGSRDSARLYFVAGFTETFRNLSRASHPDLPLLVVYAHRQEESNDEGAASTAWEAMLQALLDAGLGVNGTWPVHATHSSRQIGLGTNAIAAYVVFVCRPRLATAPLASRREFISALRATLPEAVHRLQEGNIAPVDLAQAAIGPGMAVFSRYSKVVEADGSSMTVRAALGLINQLLDETITEQEADLDADTRWAIAWFEQHGMNPGPFGVGEMLSKAKNTSINGLVAAGILESKAGTVRLRDRTEFNQVWDPATDARLTVWEVAQQLIRALESGGEEEAAHLLRRVGGLGETARELAYRLYTICERKKWAKEALAYNSLVVAWPEISRLAAATGLPGEASLF